MATRGQIKQRKKKGEMTLFKEEPKRTTRKTRRGQRSTVTEAAPSAGGARTSRKSMRDKQAEKRAAERAAEAKKPKVTGGRGRVAGKKGIGANLPAKTATATKPAATKSTTTKAVPRVVAKAPGLGSKVKTVLLGKDQKFGGDRGLIDFLPGKSRVKKKTKRTGSASKMSKRKFAGGGMASKMSAKGGARGGKKMMMPGGMKAGGSASKFPDMTGDGKVTQKDILKARGVPGFSKGDVVVNMVRELSKLGRRAFEKEYGKAALNKAIKETNKASGLTPTKAKKTPTQKKLAEADQRAELTKFTRQTPAAKKQSQVQVNAKRMERMKNGGMMKSKMSSKGGAKGGRMGGKKEMMPGGMKNGGMAKKGPKGYAKGGAMTKKGMAKGGTNKKRAVSRKPRGVGAALRGYGKAMKK